MRLEATFLRAIDGVQLLRHSTAAMFDKELAKGSGIQPASGYAQAFPERFGGLEQFIRDRHGNFHTLVIPW